MGKLHLIASTWLMIVALQHLTEAQSCKLTSWSMLHCTNLNSLEEFQNGMKNCSGKTNELLIQTSNLNYLTPQLLQELKNLKILRLLNNTLTLPYGLFESLHKLESISANFNSIELIDEGVFENLENLKKIYFTSNKLQSLPPNLFDNVSSSLVALDLGYNDLTDLIFANSTSPNLSYLSLEGNKLTILQSNSFQGLNELSSLRLGKNVIKRIDLGAFSGLLSLVFLDLSYNRIGSLPDGLFRDTPNLKYLYLYNNEIGPLNPSMFEGLKNLQSLFLQWNDISVISEGTFKKLKSLRKLQVFGNHIEEVKVGNLTNLQEIYLDVDNLEDLNGFALNNEVDVRYYDEKSKQLIKVNSSYLTNLIE